MRIGTDITNGVVIGRTFSFHVRTESASLTGLTAKTIVKCILKQIVSQYKNLRSNVL